MAAADLALTAMGAMSDVGTVRSLNSITALSAKVDELEVALVAAARFERGGTWSRMARELGVQRQSLHYRLGKKVDGLISKATPALADDPRGYWARLRREWRNVSQLLRERADDVAEIQLYTTAGRVADARADIDQRS